MPALPWIAAAAVAITADGYVKGEEARKNASEAASASKRAQEQQRSEQGAMNASEQAKERRRQIREERVRRARILQSSENTGVEGSSGETGALGNLATSFSTAVGESIGKKASGERMSVFAQDQADAQFKFNQASSDLSSASSQMSLGMSIFSAAGAFGSASTAGQATQVDPRAGVRGQLGY